MYLHMPYVPGLGHDSYLLTNLYLTKSQFVCCYIPYLIKINLKPKTSKFRMTVYQKDMHNYFIIFNQSQSATPAEVSEFYCVWLK